MLRAALMPLTIAFALALAALLAGCAERHYHYRAPDGRELSVMIRGSDTQMGSLKATAPDGTSIAIENLTTQDRTVEAFKASIDAVRDVAGRVAP